MTRSTTKRFLALSISIVAMLTIAVASCSKSSGVRLPDSTHAGDSVYALWGRTIGETYLETPNGIPADTALGGPFQRGKATSYTPRKTPSPATKHIDAMTNAEVVAYLNTLVYDMSLDHSELVLLPCKKHGSTQKCRADSLAKVYIQPEVGMSDPSRARDSIPATGVVVARIINYSTGSDTESTYKLPPSRHAWWYVDSAPGRLRSRMFVRTYQSTGPAVIFVGDTTNFEDCGHAMAPPDRPAMAKWRGCENDGGLQATEMMKTLVKPKRVGSLFQPVSFVRGLDIGDSTFLAIKTEVWITCSLGCCVGR
jgi:hypothetical protein